MGEAVDFRPQPGHRDPEPPRTCLKIRRLGLRDYAPTWQEMRAFTGQRGRDTPDELWLLEHKPVFTLGQSARHEDILDGGSSTPVILADRGGQATYHGPGQLVLYVLLDLSRRRLGIRRLVHTLEQTVIDALMTQGVAAARRDGAPGVYVRGRKLAALGLRVRRGCCYHGLALNVNMDLSPFSSINPCGFPGLKVTQLAELGVPWSVEEAGNRLVEILETHLDGNIAREAG